MSRYPTFNYSQPPASPQGDPRRSQQIDELQTVFPNVNVVGEDRSILEYGIRLRNGQAISLRILLPALFPEYGPRFVLNRSLNHPLVDSNHAVHLPLLRDWKPQYRLVDAVLQVQELLSNPGYVAPHSSPPVGQQPPPSSSYPVVDPIGQQPPPPTSLRPPHTAVQRPQQPPSQSSQGSNSATDVSHSQQKESIKQILQNLSDHELHRCLLDKQAYDQVVRRAVEELKVLESSTAVDEENIKLAEQNLEREAEIQDRVNQVAIVKSTDYASMKQLYDEKSAEYDKLRRGVDVPSMVQQLQATAQKVSGDSEALLSAAIEGRVPATDFVDDYLKLRVEYHTKDLLAKSGARLI